MNFPRSGLYAITQTEGKGFETIIQAVCSAIKGGACAIQYRDKNPIDAYYLAKQLLAVCNRNNIPLIINDDTDLACRISAHGVHLGKDDGDILLSRKKLGAKAIIGLSCYNDVNTALKAEANGVDYVAFGRFFPSNSKPLAKAASLQTLYKANNKINIPIVAIGGVLPENAEQLLSAGADVIAAIDGVFNQNPEQSAMAYAKFFN